MCVCEKKKKINKKGMKRSYKSFLLKHCMYWSLLEIVKQFNGCDKERSEETNYARPGIYDSSGHRAIDSACCQVHYLKLI